MFLRKKRVLHQGGLIARRPARSGAAVVELSLSLPLLFLIVFGSVEACNVINLQQVITEAAYEGTMAGIRSSATEQSVKDRMQAMMDAHDVLGAQFVVQGSDGSPFDNLSRGDNFRVSVTIPAGPNVIGPQVIYDFSELGATRFGVKQ